MSNYQKEIAQAHWNAKQKKEMIENVKKQERKKNVEKVKIYIEKIIHYDKPERLKNIILDMINKGENSRELGSLCSIDYEFGFPYGIRKKWQYDTSEDLISDMKSIISDINKQLEDIYTNIVYITNYDLWYRYPSTHIYLCIRNEEHESK